MFCFQSYFNKISLANSFLFLVRFHFALFFSFSYFFAWLLIFRSFHPCYFLWNLNEKQFLSHSFSYLSYLRNHTSVHIIFLQIRSLEFLRGCEVLYKLVNKVLTILWDKITWKHTNIFSKYAYRTMQFKTQ